MATLYIEEYQSLAVDAQGYKIPVAGELVAEQKVAIGASSTKSSALNNKTEFVILTPDAACQWDEDTDAAVSATATSRFLSANGARAFRVTGGNKIAVIQQQ